MSPRPRTTAYRRDTPWLAALVHRLSGLALAAFMPLHFLALGLALRGAAALDGMLAWTRDPWLKLSEIGIILALALHLLGGLRVLAIEALPWHGRHKQVVVAIAVAAVLVALGYAWLALG